MLTLLLVVMRALQGHPNGLNTAYFRPTNKGSTHMTAELQRFSKREIPGTNASSTAAEQRPPLRAYLGAQNNVLGRGGRVPLKPVFLSFSLEEPRVAHVQPERVFLVDRH